MMKIILLALAAVSCSEATADPPELPTQMTIGDAARLDRDLSHIAQLRQESERYENEATEVCRAYHINPADLNRTVKVDFSTGRITWPTSPPNTGHPPDKPRSPAARPTARK